MPRLPKLSAKNILAQVVSVCSTAVERTPSNREVMGLCPAGFFIFSILPVMRR